MAASLPLRARAVVTFTALFALLATSVACEPVDRDEIDEPAAAGPQDERDRPHVMAATPEEAGEYLVHVGGCNDCHTDGWLQTEGDIPRERWLTGMPVGWRGPWGTTYGRNLRLTVQRVTEEEWVHMLRTRDALPPMPWMNVHRLSAMDARAIYRFVRELGPAGEEMPPTVPPDQEPETPYFLLVPQMPGGGAAPPPGEAPPGG